MILKDSIELWTSPDAPGGPRLLDTVPAMVSWTRTGRRYNKEMGIYPVSELRASFEQAKELELAAQVKHAGKTWDVSGPPMVSMRGAAVHHYELALVLPGALP